MPLPPGAEERGTVSLEAFSRQIKWLRRLGVAFVRMSDLLAWLEGSRKLPRKAAVLTFDDAYTSVAEHAFPILKQENIPFTVFVIADLIGGQSHYYGNRGGRPLQHLDKDDLLMLIQSGLVEIGSHGFQHLDVTAINAEALTHELKGSKQFLEYALNVEVPYYAYPIGRNNPEAVNAVKQYGFKLAFTTRKQKLASRRIDFWRLPRVTWSRNASVVKLFKYFILPGGL